MKRRKPGTIVEVTDNQYDFCVRRTDFLLFNVGNLTFSHLLANAYHQGIIDTVETIMRNRLDILQPAVKGADPT